MSIGFSQNTEGKHARSKKPTTTALSMAGQTGNTNFNHVCLIQSHLPHLLDMFMFQPYA
jgi:hypothetical protein